MNRARQTLGILAGTALLLVAWTLVLRALPGRAQLAESNFQANRIRLEGYLLGPPKPAVLVGSSMIGRVLPTYFDGTPLAGTANLGLDGSGALFGLRLIRERSPAAKLVFVEANLLAVPASGNDQALQEAISGFTFTLVSHVEWLGAAARPSTLLYSSMKLGRDARVAGLTAAESPRVTSQQEIVFDQSTPQQRTNHAAAVAAELKLLKEAGTRILLVRFPTATSLLPNGARVPDLADELATALGMAHVDLGAELRARGHEPRFTDGTHLTASSAREVAKLLAERGKTP